MVDTNAVLPIVTISLQPVVRPILGLRGECFGELSRTMTGLLSGGRCSSGASPLL